MKIYIAGKITGLVYEDALRAFTEAETMLRDRGHEPVNPMRENPGNDLPWAEYMKRDIPHLLACDAVYLLPNWHDSKGARLEKHIAEELGLLLVYAENNGHRKCQVDGCRILFIPKRPAAEVDLCPQCEDVLARAMAA